MIITPPLSYWTPCAGASALDAWIHSYDKELAILTRAGEQARRRASIPDIGIFNATVLLAAAPPPVASSTLTGTAVGTMVD